jgi:hypothetical protein
MSFSYSLSFFRVYHDSFNAPATEPADRTAAVQLRKCRTKMMREIHRADARLIQAIEMT